MCEITPERKDFLQGEITGNNLEGSDRVDRMISAINNTKFTLAEPTNFERSIFSQIVSVVEQNCPEN